VAVGQAEIMMNNMEKKLWFQEKNMLKIGYLSLNTNSYKKNYIFSKITDKFNKKKLIIIEKLYSELHRINTNWAYRYNNKRIILITTYVYQPILYIHMENNTTNLGVYLTVLCSV
jgi:hypothetical protein